MDSTVNNDRLERKVSSHSLPVNINMHRPSEEVVSRPFVGRLGGNQAFTLSQDDPDYDEKIRRTPDAVPSFSWKESFDLRGFREAELWKQAILEGWASSMLVWINGLAAFTFAPTVK